MSRQRYVAAGAIACALALPVGAQQAPDMPERETPRAAYDHYEPGALAQAALDHMREGDLSGACVLVWRAHALAPRDPRVAHAAAEFAQRLAGTFTSPLPPPVATAPPPPAAAARPAPEPPPEPPPAWPLRPK